jgi:acetyl esterase/lipase
METKIITLNEKRKVTLTCYLQETGEGYGHLRERPAILILPGGGYTHCSNREADPAAFAYLKAGFQAFILRYTCQDTGKWPLPLEDYEEACKLIRRHASDWHVDLSKTACIGFSAGGHLAAAGALLTPCKPKALILGYALTGREVEKYAPGYPSLLEQVDKDAPPAFLFATSNDHSVSVSNTLAYAQKLAEQGVMFECHVYPYGHHGYSTGEPAVQKDRDPLHPRVRKWTEDSIDFLHQVFEPEDHPAAF